MSLTRMPLAVPPPMERKAEALAELQEIYAAYEEAVQQTQRDAREILRLQDRVAMLDEELRNERERARVCERKLIRLAANQRNISRIAQDGDEIMRSVQDWQELEIEGDTSAREMAERLAPEQPEDETNVSKMPVNRL